MLDRSQCPWTPALRALWDRIGRHDFEPAIALNFTDRLARDKGWSLERARATVAEYRHFCFLAVASAKPVTPSEEVDEVWHLHLTYTRDYWDRWCGEALRVPLHHDPTLGGPAQGALFRQQYAATLQLYERFFGPPDPAFWPGTARRFARPGRYRTVDLDTSLTVPRPKVLLRRLIILKGNRWT